MTSQSFQSAPIAFFGATGGCANAALVLALQSSIPCTALARTPSKLHEMLWAKGVSRSTTDALLQITKGDVKDAEAVKQVFSYDRNPVSTIVFGIGMVFGGPSSMDTTICQVGMRSVLTALKEVVGEMRRPPHLVAISTTGVSGGKRDVPVLFGPLYHVLLAKPHVDKRAMEKLVEGAAVEGSVAGFTLVRPSLLSNGKELGMEKVRVGTEEDPAVGYFISRLDVGRWIFEELIVRDRGRWNGKKVSITH